MFGFRAHFALVAVAIAVVSWPNFALGQECANVLVVFDRSDSMNRLVTGSEQSRWDVAVPAIESLVSRYADNVRFGLMLFPGGTLDSCDLACTPGFVAVELSARSGDAIEEALSSTVQCAGTPIGVSLQVVQGLTSLRDRDRQNYVILVTDGSETCTEPADAIAAELLESSPAIRTFVIGFGSSVNEAELNQISSAGGTERAFVADDGAALEAAFDQILGSVYSDPEFGCVGGEFPDGGLFAPDSGVDPTEVPPSDDSSGCTCSSTPGSAYGVGLGAWMLLPLVGVATLVRRRNLRPDPLR